MPTNPTDSLERELTYAVPEIHPYHRALVAVFIREREKGLREERTRAISGVIRTCEAHREDRNRFAARAEAQLAESQREIERLTRECQGWQNTNGVLNEHHVELRAEVATLRKEREYRFADLAALNAEVVESHREIERLNPLEAENTALKTELAARDQTISDMQANMVDGLALVEANEQNATLKTEVELLRAVSLQADRYIKSHAGQVVRLQDAATATAYAEAERALCAALAAVAAWRTGRDGA